MHLSGGTWDSPQPTTLTRLRGTCQTKLRCLSYIRSPPSLVSVLHSLHVTTPPPTAMLMLHRTSGRGGAFAAPGKPLEVTGKPAEPQRDTAEDAPPQQQPTGPITPETKAPPKQAAATTGR
eukprot:TRINITY_DN45480_c0_g1_i1.p1 TRINITY_DN45480_c0_g1~~TRINITY_DN45480_c0_g1_i1.p1  ORF type:complete len:121 (+),score=13.38 TRINITY_DN45480_c0_g1_i1:188-550(+)